MEDINTESKFQENDIYHILIETMIKTQALEDILLEKNLVTKEELTSRQEIISKVIVDMMQSLEEPTKEKNAQDI